MFEIKNIEVSYDTRIIEPSILTFYPEEITTICGKSGAGKTSLLNIIAFCKDNHYKEMIYDGKTITKENKEDFRLHHIFYMKQNYDFIDGLTCLGHIELVSPQVNKKDIEDIFRWLAIDIELDSYPDNLSTGQKQRFYLALGILSQADILLCDELSASLDKASKQKMLDIIKILAHDHHKYILFATHDSDVMAISDRVYQIENKQVTCKQSASEEKTVSKTEVKKNDSFLYFLKYHLHHIKDKYNMYYRTLIILIVSICGIGYIFGQQETIQNRYLLSFLNDYEYYLFNGNDDAYKDRFIPFEASTIDEIQETLNIDKIYPFITLPANEGYYDINNDYQKGLVGNYTFTFNGQEVTMTDNRVLYTYPYYPESHLELACSSYIDKPDGAYIGRLLAHFLNIDEVTEGMTIEYTLPIPVDYIIQGNPIPEESVPEDEEWVSQLRRSHCVLKTISIPIAGILSDIYTENGGDCNIYIPHELLFSLIDENKIKYDYSSYVFFNEDELPEETIHNAVTTIDPNITVFNVKNYLEDGMQKDFQIESMVRLGLYGGILALVVLNVLYGLYQKKTLKKTMDTLKTFGYSKKLQKRYLYASLLILMVSIFIGSFLLTNAVYFCLKEAGAIHTTATSSIPYWGMLVWIIGLSVILPILAHLPVIVGKSLYD